VDGPDVGGLPAGPVGGAVVGLGLGGPLDLDAGLVALHLPAAPVLGPAQDRGQVAGHRVGGGQAAVGGLDGDPGPPHQHVVQVQGALGGGVDGLGGQVVLGPGQRLGQLGPVGEQVQDLVDGGAVAVEQVLDPGQLQPGGGRRAARRFQAAR
jgi:hypothetical protein